MRCPRCGAFLDNNKTICFMCGAALNSENSVENAQSNNEISEKEQSFDNGFNNVNPFGNSFDNNQNNMSNNQVNNQFANNTFNNFDNQNLGGFNNPTVNNSNVNGFNNPSVISDDVDAQFNAKVFGRKNEVKINEDYKNIKLEDIKTDKDIFDFFSEHKKGIKLFFLILLLAGVGFGVYMFIKSKNAPEKKEPLIGNLYFKVDDKFDLIQSSQSLMVYSLSGSKGSDCSITIESGTTTSGNHVLDFFEKNEKNYAPEKDQTGNIVNQLDVFKAETNEFEINKQLWSRQYFYYRTDLNSVDYSLLKKIFLTTMYKGYYYDLSLVNNSNSTSCNVELDSFVNSLEFVDVKKAKK